MRRREVWKFLSGFLAGAGAVHANMGFAIATGAGSLWIGASVYLVASLVLGYLAWRPLTPERDLPSRPG